MKLTNLRGILQYIPQFWEKTFITEIDDAIVTGADTLKFARTVETSPLGYWTLLWLRAATAVAIILFGLAGAPSSGVAATGPQLKFTVLHFLDAIYPNNGGTNNSAANHGGVQPFAKPCLDSGVIYGTTAGGGSSGIGTIFSMNSDGSGFTVLHNFVFAEGATPCAGLISSGGMLYGTTINGGATFYGTVFAVKTNGTGFTLLHKFTALNGSAYTNLDGGYPQGALILSGNTLYGTASAGGTGGGGTVFAINLANTNFTAVHQFPPTAYDSSSNLTNKDGSAPLGDLILSGQTLFGTTFQGGPGGIGTVFAVNTNGANFSVLHGFSALNPIYNTNSDGGNPFAGVIISGGTLYGAALLGGRANNGTVFSVNTNGANFTNLYSFTGGSDGSAPDCDLVLSGSTLLGTTRAGGSSTTTNGNGTIFSLDLNNKNFAVVHTFIAGNNDPNLPAFNNTMTNSDGATPRAGLALSGDGTLYGTTGVGGTNGTGSIFSLSAAELAILNITLSGTNLVLAGSNGQSNGTYVTWMSTNLSLSLTQWTPVATNTLSAAGNFTITATNAVNTKAKQQFYILQTQ